MLTDKDAACTQDRLVQELSKETSKLSNATIEMLTAWTTFMMTGNQDPKLSPEAKKELAARKEFQKIWDLKKELLKHPAYTPCPERHVFWTDFSAGAKHLAQKFVRF